MHFTFKIYIIFFTCLFSLATEAQVTAKKEKKLIQFSGIVVTSDSLGHVPFASVMIKGTKKGAISDYFGFFSFVAEAGDVIEFSALGYKPASYLIPDSLKLSRYSWIQVLNTDTIYLSETVITPWPTIEQFKKTFVETVPLANTVKRCSALVSKIFRSRISSKALSFVARIHRSL